MQLENILRARFRRTIAEVTPILKRRLTPTQLDLLMETLSIAQESVLDSLDDIINDRVPSNELYEDSEDDIEDFSNEEE
jgi:hypothetical protein